MQSQLEWGQNISIMLTMKKVRRKKEQGFQNSIKRGKRELVILLGGILIIL